MHRTQVSIHLPLSALLASVLLGGTAAQSRQEVQRVGSAGLTKAQTHHSVVPGQLHRGGRHDAEHNDFAPAEGSPFVLAFPGGQIQPKPGLDPRLAKAATADPDGTTFAYVMVEGSLSAPSRRATLQRLGCEILGAHTWQSLVVRIPNRAVWSVKELSFVRWVGYATTAQKIHPLLQAQIASSKTTNRLPIVVNVFASDRGKATIRRPVDAERTTNKTTGRSVEMPLYEEIPNGPFQRALERAGFRFVDYSDHAGVVFFRGTATAREIANIAKLDFVSFVERRLDAKAFDDQSVLMIGIDRVRGDFDGTGITAGVIDSGLAGGTAAATHVDVRSKTMIGVSTMPQGAFVDRDGHGTHVTGTVAGEGRADSRYMGCAPGIGAQTNAALFVGRYLDQSGTGFGNVQTIYDFMSKTQNGSPKPRVINCSWGVATSNGIYFTGTEADCRQADGQVWAERQLLVFAAGNSGLGTGVGTPGAAKNVLTVGSVDDFWQVANNRFPGNMSPFSAHGTKDGRHKPEVVAPGSIITSMSHLSDRTYRRDGGTSMAAPHVTGTLTGLIQHYRSLDYQPEALKAIACASAQWQGSPGTTSGVQAAPGFGLIDANRMHWSDARGGMVLGSSNLKFTTVGDYQSWDIDVPADCTAIKVVSVWSEPAASAGATTARVNELRMHLDVAPFQSGGASGEFHVRPFGNDNILSLVSRATDASGLCAASRGKKLRVKVRAFALPTEAYVGLGVLFLRKAPNGLMPIHTVALSKAIVHGGESFTITSKLDTPAGSDVYQNARLFPSLPAGFSATALTFETADGLRHRYTNSVGYPSSPFPSPTEGMTVGLGAARTLIYTVKAPGTDGVYPVGASFWADPRTGSGLKTKMLCVDNSAPASATGHRSSTHQPGVWSSNPNITIRWDPATDTGCAGVAGYAHTLTKTYQRPGAQTLAANQTTITARLTENSTATPYYLRMRTIDRAGNESLIRSYGPFFVDLTPPRVLQYSLNSGATHLRSLLELRCYFDVRDEQSGIKDYRYTLDGTTWSPWAVLPSSSYPVEVLRYGGTDQPGVKTVTTEFRNLVGNVVRSVDTIIYVPVPKLTNAPVGSTLGNQPVVLRGTGLGQVNELTFNGVQLSTNRLDWLQGYYRVQSATEIHLYPPQGLPGTRYSVIVKNVTGTSGTVIRLDEPTTDTLATQPESRPGQAQSILMHSGLNRGPLVGTVLASWSTKPSILPGVISLDMGDNFQSIIIFPGRQSFDPLAGYAAPLRFAVPVAARGLTMHYQAYLFHPNKPPKGSLRVTNRATTNY